MHQFNILVFWISGMLLNTLPVVIDEPFPTALFLLVSGSSILL